MVIWEYAQIRVDGRGIWWTGDGGDRQLDGPKANVIDRLNVAGKDGWELVVGVTETAMGHTVVTKYVLKRRIETG
jgi:hypothetical protein